MYQSRAYRFNISIVIDGLYSERNDQPPIRDWLEVRKVLSNLVSGQVEHISLDRSDPLRYWIEGIAKRSSERYLEDIRSVFDGDETRINRIQISELTYSPGSLLIDFAYNVLATAGTYVTIRSMIHQFKIDLQASLKSMTFGYVDVRVKKNVYKFKFGRKRERKFKIRKSYITALTMVSIFAIAMWYNSYTRKQQLEEMKRLVEDELLATQEKRDSIP